MGDDCWRSSAVIGGQTARLDFCRCWDFSAAPTYNAYMRMLNKRRDEGAVGMKSTGRVGLSGLLWCKLEMLKFGAFIAERNGRASAVIVRWDDNRRRRVYERGLRDAGFAYRMLSPGGKSTKFLYRKFQIPSRKQ